MKRIITFLVLGVLAFLGFAANIARAQNGTYATLTVTGTASVNILDIPGNYLTLGSWINNSSQSGVNFTYYEATGGTNAAFYNVLTRPVSAWEWLRLDGSGNAWAVMGLDQSNRLTLTGTQHSSPGLIVIDPTAGQITINNQAVITASQTGYVGIGTSDPTRGRLEVDQSVDSDTGGIAIENSVASGGLRLWVDGSGVVHFDNGSTDNGAIGLNVSGTGGVSIGVASPTRGRLEVHQAINSNAGGIALTNTASTASLRVWMDGNGATHFDDGGSSLLLSGSSILFSGSSACDVGIGTTNPVALLDIYGSTTSGLHLTNTAAPSITSGGGISGYMSAIPTAADQRLGFYTLGAIDSGTNRNSVAIQGFSSQPWVSGSAIGSYLTFSVTPNNSLNRVEAMRIIQNGNVGVGTVTPKATLDVNGGGRFAGNVVVTGTTNMILVNAAGDLSMGSFTAGPVPQ